RAPRWSPGCRRSRSHRRQWRRPLFEAERCSLNSLAVLLVGTGRRVVVTSEPVVVLLGLAEPHGVRRRLHSLLQGSEELLLGVDEAFAAVVGELRSEEHTSELQSRENLVCRLLLE